MDKLEESNEKFRTSAQVSRPYLTKNAVSLLHEKTIIDHSAYKQRLSRTIQFLSSVCNQLKFPNRTLAAAMLYYQRYYLFNLFVPSGYVDVALAALLVASKNEDTIKKLRDIIAAANTFRGVNLSIQEVEEVKKSVLNIEKKLLETICYDFRIYHVDELLARIAKDLNIEFELAYLAYQISYDSMQTEILLVVPAHAVAIACIIIAAKFKSDNSIFPLDSSKYSCERSWINEAIFVILDLYMSSYNHCSIAESYPGGQEKFMNIRIDMKGEADMPGLSRSILRKDRFYQKKDYTISESGSSRYMLGIQEKRLRKELEDQRAQKRAAYVKRSEKEDTSMKV